MYLIYKTNIHNTLYMALSLVCHYHFGDPPPPKPTPSEQDGLMETIIENARGIGGFNPPPRNYKDPNII